MLGIFRRRSPMPPPAGPRLRADDAAVVHAVGDTRGWCDLLLELVEDIRDHGLVVVGTPSGAPGIRAAVAQRWRSSTRRRATLWSTLGPRQRNSYLT